MLVLLALALAAIWPLRFRRASTFVYAVSLAVSLLLLGAAATRLISADAPSILALPLGLPWIGAHFRIDALSAFFLTVVNLGAAAASLYGLGYGRHEHEPGRVLPFFPAFLAGMNLVLVADDAYVFLLCWELMSLASWALVMAHHAGKENARAGYVYILMASIGAFALLLAFGALAGPGRRLHLRRDPRPSARAGRRGDCAGPRPARRGFESGAGAFSCLAPARPSRRAEPCLRPDERRHDQGGGLWLHPHRV